MKQPELGNKIHEIRTTKGLTQKELSESCNVDIRTIQRIESGEVIPRWSTVRILAVALECDEKIFNVNGVNGMSSDLRKILLFSFFLGILYFINWLFYSTVIPVNILTSIRNLFLPLSVIHLLTGVIFYYGFFVLGKFKKNKILQIAALVILIIIPLFVISDVISVSSTYVFTLHLKRLFVIILGINGILFGIGLMKAKSQLFLLYKITGVLQILIGPMFIIQIPVIQLIGLWLSIPFILLLLTILLLEYRVINTLNLSSERA